MPLRLRTLLAALFHRSRFEAEMAEELAFHLRSRTEELVARGLSPEAAARQARLEFGGVELQKEHCREAWGLRLLDELRADLRYALRTLRKSPTFTAVAILTLALAIGANTAVFSLLDALVFRDLPVPHPEQLVQISVPLPTDPHAGLSLPMFEELRRSQTGFSSLIGWEGDTIVSVEAGNGLAQANLWDVTGNFYAQLGVRPYAGRLLTPRDVDLQTQHPGRVVVLGYGFWRRHWGADPSIIGRSIRIEGVPFTVVGVAPPGFKGFGLTHEPDVTIPLTAAPLIFKGMKGTIDDGATLWIQTTGRLKEGVTLAQASAKLHAFWPLVKTAVIPSTYAGAHRKRFLALPLDVRSEATGSDRSLRDQFVRPLYLLEALALFILLIATLNLASLMFARGAARMHETGVRLALGAGRGRLVRQYLVEGLLLTFAGVLCGLPLAAWSSGVISTQMLYQGFGPATLDVSLDARILGFTLLLALVAGTLFALLPAWGAVRAATLPVQASHSQLRPPRANRVGGRLIATQIACSLMLLVASGLLVRTLVALRDVDTGFSPTGVLLDTLYPDPGQHGQTFGAAYYQSVIARVDAVPGVQRAAISPLAPFSPWDWVRSVSRTSGTSQPTSTVFDAVSPGFFSALSIPFLGGRDFRWQDNSTAPPVIIVSQSLASRLFPGGHALGRHVHVTKDVVDRLPAGDYAVVGVVADARLFNVKVANPNAAFMPLLQTRQVGHRLVVKMDPRRQASFKAVANAVRSLGHEYVVETMTADQASALALVQERLTAQLAGFFGLVALLLAAIGLFGLMSYSVTVRTQEIGVRMALGARLHQVVALVLGSGLRIAVIGLLIGLAGAVATTRLLRSLLFGVSPRDPVTFVAAPLLLLATVLLACLIPAWRAARIDPARTLRAE